MAQNGDTLLNYILQLDVRTPTPDASTDYLRAVVAVVKPKGETPVGELTKVISPEAAKSLTDNADVEQLFNAGMNSVLILPMSDLSAVGAALSSVKERFYTLLISSDYTDDEVQELDIGTFPGVTAYAFTEQAAAKNFAAQKNHCGFLTGNGNKAANMFYAFGELLSNSGWDNQQYIPLPKDDGIVDLGLADDLFADRISFALTSEEYGSRMAFFSAGGQAIIAPYVTQELYINLQGGALRYLNINRPQYTLVQAKLLQDYLTSYANTRYVDTRLLAYVSISIALTKSNYEGNITVAIPEPSALWRLKGILTQEAL